MVVLPHQSICLIPLKEQVTALSSAYGAITSQDQQSYSDSNCPHIATIEVASMTSSNRFAYAPSGTVQRISCCNAYVGIHGCINTSGLWFLNSSSRSPNNRTIGTLLQIVRKTHPHEEFHRTCLLSRKTVFAFQEVSHYERYHPPGLTFGHENDPHNLH